MTAKRPWSGSNNEASASRYTQNACWHTCHAGVQQQQHSHTNNALQVSAADLRAHPASLVVGSDYPRVAQESGNKHGKRWKSSAGHVCKQA